MKALHLKDGIVKINPGTEYTEKSPISTKIEYTYVAVNNKNLVAVYEENEKASVHISGSSYSIKVGDGESQSKDSDYSVDVEIGKKVTLTTTKTGFVNWINDIGKILSESSTYTFIVTSDSSVKMTESGTAGETVTALVQFITEDNQVISSGIYSTENVDTIAPSTVPSKVGYTFTGWSVVGYESISSSDGIIAAVTNALNDSQTNIVIKPLYVKEANDTRAVKVYINGFLDKTQSRKDTNLYAIYVKDNVEVEKQPVILITNKYASIVEHGMLYCKDGSNRI